MPPIPGADAPHVFKLWTVRDMDRLHRFINELAPKTVVVVGGGFIGLEMAEAPHKRQLSTTVVELLPTVMSLMDPEFGVQIAAELSQNGVSVITGLGIKAAVHGEDKSVECSSRRAHAPS